MRTWVIIMTPNMLPMCSWARSRLVHMFSWRSHVKRSMQHGLLLTMRHVYGHAGNVGNECADHALCQIITLLHVGFVIALTPLPVLVLATTLAKSWKTCATLELEQRRYLFDRPRTQCITRSLLSALFPCVALLQHLGVP